MFNDKTLQYLNFNLYKSLPGLWKDKLLNKREIPEHRLYKIGKKRVTSEFNNKFKTFLN